MNGNVSGATSAGSSRFSRTQNRMNAVIQAMKAQEPMWRATLSEMRPNRSLSTDGRSDMPRSSG
jgi:hypothetical protein